MGPREVCRYVVHALASAWRVLGLRPAVREGRRVRVQGGVVLRAPSELGQAGIRFVGQDVWFPVDWERSLGCEPRDWMPALRDCLARRRAIRAEIRPGGQVDSLTFGGRRIRFP